MIPAVWKLLPPLALAALLVVGAPAVVGAADANPDLPPCLPACDGLQCGDDGCGGSCGECPPYHACLANLCQFNGGCEPLTIPGCGGCSCEACVCSLDPYCCSGAWDALCVARCQNQCGGCGKELVCGDGTCHPGEDCYGCPKDCGSCPVACGSITGKGCCAEATLLRCELGGLTITNCLDQGFDSCGWDVDMQQYACGHAGEDPAGIYPLKCQPPPVDDVVDAIPFPDECNGLSFLGCCDGQTLHWCAPDGLHSVDCAANPAPFNTCGWSFSKGFYDCGGTGADPSGVASPECPLLQTDLTVLDTVAPSCKVGTLVAVGCDSIPWEGCCNTAGALLFCEAGKLLCKLDCSGLVYPADTCGWHAGQPGYYDCGGDGPDPSGDFALECPLVEPLPDVVVDYGAPTPSCPFVPDSGCCQDGILHWCEGGIQRTFDCALLAQDPVFHAYVHCGTNPVSGMADCLKKPDPSPPACGESEPEPAPEPTPEPTPDAGPQADGIPDNVGDALPFDHFGADADDPGKDGSGFVIPVDAVEPEPPRKKDGCNANNGPASPGAGWLLLGFLWLLYRAARSPSTNTD